FTPSQIVTSYGLSFDGFEPWLSEEDSNKLSCKKQWLIYVVSVFPSVTLKLHQLDVINECGIHPGLITHIWLLSDL
ncbi:unnamed protein product, partial [Brassica oleracea var. botrytis]